MPENPFRLVKSTTAAAALKAHQEAQDEAKKTLGADYTDLGLVFTSETGTPLRARNVIRAFKALLATKEVNLPREVRVHDLRHTVGTNLLASGTDIATAARILGHASPQVTATVYAHVLPRGTAQALDRLEAAYQKAAAPPRGGTEPPLG